MDDTEGAKGERFSQVYLTTAELLEDSLRFRRRLAIPASKISGSNGLADLIHSELGIRVPVTGGYQSHYDWERFFEKTELRDVLDSITLAYRLIVTNSTARQGAEWCKQVERIMREERTKYRVDAAGGVHFYTDAEFERQRATTLRSLEGKRYGAVRASYDASHGALDGERPNTVQALREMFSAIETLFKLMDARASRLGPSEISRHLIPILQRTFQGNELDAAKLYAKSLGEWVNAMHHYRHAQGVEEPAPPFVDFTVALMASGGAYLRWLARIDRADQSLSEKPA